jgi:hypothetical protein
LLIRITAEYHLPLIAPADHVLKRSGKFHARVSRHRCLLRQPTKKAKRKPDTLRGGSNPRFSEQGMIEVEVGGFCLTVNIGG